MCNFIQQSFSPGGDLDNYLSRIYSTPLLTIDEEKSLAKSIQENGDEDARRKLILHNLRFVAHMARKYLGYGLPLADIIQEGNIGLTKAIDRFEPERGVRLSSFSVHSIKAEINEYVIKNSRTVKIATTKSQRKLFFKLRGMRSNNKYLTESEAEQIAEQLDVPVFEVKTMELRFSTPENHYDTCENPDYDEDLSGAITLQAIKSSSLQPSEIVSNQEESNIINAALHTAITQLSERDQEIIRSRWLSSKKETLTELSVKYEVSAERIRQLEKRAIKLLKEILSGIGHIEMPAHSFLDVDNQSVA